jgi:DNA-damage-inducible protein D
MAGGKKMKEKSDTHIAIFNGKSIRRKLVGNRWFFSVVDIVGVLTESVNPRDYISQLKQRDEELSKGWRQFVSTLSIQTEGGKQQMNCADTEGIFRIIQSIPSKKAEPFKRWLARVGYERVQEIENPELAQERMKELNSKIYKVHITKYINMLPGDRNGSPDESLLFLIK